MIKKALSILALTSRLAFSQEAELEKPAPETAPKPEIKRISETEYAIGKISLDKAKREIRFGAGVNMTKGLIEYLLVTTKSNKVHEALFLSDISPLNLNIALKLIGINESPELFEIIDEETWKPTGKFPEVTPEVRAASLIDIFIEWGAGDGIKRLPINEFIHHINWPEEAQAPQPSQEVDTQELSLSIMEAGPWLSTGSYLHEGRFKAEVIGMLIAIYTAEQAIVNFPGKDRQLGDVWIPNQKTVPAEGTVVKFIITPHTPPKK